MKNNDNIWFLSQDVFLDNIIRGYHCRLCWNRLAFYNGVINLLFLLNINIDKPQRLMKTKPFAFDRTWSSSLMEHLGYRIRENPLALAKRCNMTFAVSLIEDESHRQIICISLSNEYYCLHQIEGVSTLHRSTWLCGLHESCFHRAWICG